MPELPEVETVRRGLAPALTGRRIDSLAVTRDRAVRRQPHAEFVATVRGRTIREVRRHGKFLIFDLGGGDAIVGHLRMSGQLRIASPADDVAKHTHVVVDLDDGSQLRFVDPRTFGELYVDELVGDRPRSLAHLGPDAIARITDRAFHERLVGQRRRATVKAALLDQTTVAGVGNIYADEALFAARIHPQRPVTSVTAGDAAALRTNLQRILRAAVASRGTTFDDFAYVDAYGRRGRFVPQIYGRADRPCVRCGTPIAKLVVAQRGTHVCPTCQASPN
ncbi:MAG TPA: bifunctional DNA-formamidopyrimidine glycosylase/DNA-(apurinic or apyrimidinic site) lyase [Acidimicrobiales bacterium]|nr:bifunctional DNA-formamidopyrimidine glycosylase/DNA-(apurinic or apyrimidinic site) lyase [Acidimicrobiales bacterium]